jgi:AcrR family transcriptional regulator
VSEVIRARRRRADAERSAAVVLDAAVEILGQHPDASVEAIAAAAGVSRQTVYAHFPSRQLLLEAVIGRITEEVLAAIDASGLDVGTPTSALLRWLDATWQLIDRYPLLLHPSIAVVESEESRSRHLPIIDRLEALIRRGRRTGEFDRRLPADWLLTATMALGHAAGDEVGAGRMTSDQARRALRASVLRLFGVGNGPEALT